MSAKGIFLTLASIAVLGGSGYYGYNKFMKPAPSVGNVGQMNTAKIDHQHKAEVKAQQQADHKKYQIPKVENHAVDAIKTTKGIDQSQANGLAAALTRTFQYLSSQDSALAHGEQSDFALPHAFKLQQSYTSDDAAQQTLKSLNRTTQDGANNTPKPGELYQIDSLTLTSPKTDKAADATTYQADLSYSANHGKQKYRVTGQLQVDDHGRVMMFTPKPISK